MTTALTNSLRYLFLAVWLCLCTASLSQSATITHLLGGAVIGPLPAGTCLPAAFQFVRDSGVEIIAVDNVTDFDVDLATNRAYVTIQRDPFAVNNFYKFNTVSPVSFISSLRLRIDLGAGFCDDLIGPMFAQCVFPHVVRYDSLNDFAYAGGTQILRDSTRSIGVVTGSTMVLNTINNTQYSVGAGGGGNTGAVLGFDGSLSWFGFGSLDLVSNPNNNISWRVNRGIGATRLQGPVSTSLSSNGMNSQGAMEVDVVNNYLYIPQTDAIAGTLSIRVFNFSLVEQTVYNLATDLVAPGSWNQNAIRWVPEKNELLVCTTNYLAVYSGYPFTLKRSIASGCNSPAADVINNKIYVNRGFILTRVNYNTLAQEAQQAAPTGLAAGTRLFMDATRQFIYGIEQGGASSVGTAFVKYDVCSSV